MSFDFNSGNINHQFKAQAAYKDGGGMGGGGMYFQQGKKKKEEAEDDIFQKSKDETPDELQFQIESELKEEDIPKEQIFNKFVNWFRRN